MVLYVDFAASLLAPSGYVNVHLLVPGGLGSNLFSVLGSVMVPPMAAVLGRGLKGVLLLFFLVASSNGDPLRFLGTQMGPSISSWPCLGTASVAHSPTDGSLLTSSGLLFLVCSLDIVPSEWGGAFQG